jgi:hypothetical protein
MHNIARDGCRIPEDPVPKKRLLHLRGGSFARQETGGVLLWFSYVAEVNTFVL